MHANHVRCAAAAQPVSNITTTTSLTPILIYSLKVIQSPNAEHIQGPQQGSSKMSLTPYSPKKRARMNESFDSHPSLLSIRTPSSSTRTPAQQPTHTSNRSGELEMNTNLAAASSSPSYSGHTYAAVGVRDNARVHMGDNYYAAGM